MSHKKSLRYNGLFINVVAIKHSSIPWLSYYKDLGGILNGDLLASGGREEHNPVVRHQLPLYQPNPRWRQPPVPPVPLVFPQFKRLFLETSSVCQELYEKTLTLPQGCHHSPPPQPPNAPNTTTGTRAMVIHKIFPSWALHWDPPPSPGTRLSLLSTPITTGL